MLYNPKERKIERNLLFPGPRVLANSGNWCLLLDSASNLFIVDVFSKETIPLPSLESIRSTTCSIKRVGDVVRGLLWVDEGRKDYVVVWFFDREYNHDCLSFCKKGNTHYTDIPLFDRDAH